MMNDTVYLTILFDYYESLLSDRDRSCFRDYYFSNLSLSEIALASSVSRNAIHKRLKKICDELYLYESKLGLYEKEKRIMDLIHDEVLKEKIKEIL